jgi:hypothetical protein
MRKTQDRLLTLMRAKEGVLRFEASRFGVGTIHVDGNLISPSFRLGPDQAKAARDLLDEGAIEHEHPGVPRRSGKISITLHGQVLLGEWTTEKLSVVRRTMLRAAAFQNLREFGFTQYTTDSGVVDGAGCTAVRWLETHRYIETILGNVHVTDAGYDWLDANGITG